MYVFQPTDAWLYLPRMLSRTGKYNLHACMHVHMHACMHVHMHACMYVLQSGRSSSRTSVIMYTILNWYKERGAALPGMMIFNLAQTWLQVDCLQHAKMAGPRSERAGLISRGEALVPSTITQPRPREHSCKPQCGLMSCIQNW